MTQEQEYGIVWLTEEVSKQHGPNKSDRVITCGDAQIPKVVNLDKFRAKVGDDKALFFINGTSLRVRAQGVNRDNAKLSVEKRRALVLDAINGVRVVGGRVTVRYALPNGEFYGGSDLTEYRQLYTVALVEQGVPAELAANIAQQQNLK